MSGQVHRYQAICSWKGSTGAGYERYDRTHEVSALPARDQLAVSADPAFLGNADQLNPEQLLLMAAASCQLLSFLAVAARARIDVVRYEDSAEAVMPEDDPPLRITAIRLRPRIIVRGPGVEQRLRRLVDLAHRECFIANSLSCPVTVEPAFEFVGNVGDVGALEDDN